MNQYFDDELLQEFMYNFYGYGNYQGDYWFVGMEEGGGDSVAEINQRITTWDQRGRSELEDVVDYHRALGIDWPFAEKPKLQSTWSKLIRVLLSMQGQNPTTDEVRFYQQRHWARQTGSVCLLELLPLPSPSTRQWIYGQYSQLSDLVSREYYRTVWSELRVKALQQRILQHKPKVVIFYSFSYLTYWQEITGDTLQLALSGNIYAQQHVDRLYVVLKHPVATGVTNEYFHQAGRYIHLNLAGNLPDMK